jgi:hypothetical protein
MEETNEPYTTLCKFAWPVVLLVAALMAALVGSIFWS